MPSKIPTTLSLQPRRPAVADSRPPPPGGRLGLPAIEAGDKGRRESRPPPLAGPGGGPAATGWLTTLVAVHSVASGACGCTDELGRTGRSRARAVRQDAVAGLSPSHRPCGPTSSRAAAAEYRGGRTFGGRRWHGTSRDERLVTMMRMSSLLFVLVAEVSLALSSCASEAGMAEERAWRELLSHEGQDGWDLDRAAWNTFTKLLRRRLPQDADRSEFLRAWAVVRFESVPRVVVFEASAIGWNIQGDFPVRAHVFTEEGEWLSTEDFSGGWCIMWGLPRAVHLTSVDAEVLKIIAGSSIDKFARWTQYYGLRNNRLVLLRLEDASGKAIPNENGAPNWTVGPILKSPKEVPWEESLSSEDPVERLSALVWLGGTHVNPNLPTEWKYSHEDVTVGAFCEELRNRPGISARLHDLAASPNPWVREAALLALSPQRYH